MSVLVREWKGIIDRLLYKWGVSTWFISYRISTLRLMLFVNAIILLFHSIVLDFVLPWISPAFSDFCQTCFSLKFILQQILDICYGVGKFRFSLAHVHCSHLSTTTLFYHQWVFPPFLPPLLFLSLKNKSKSLPLLITKIQRKGISLQLKSLQTYLK